MPAMLRRYGDFSAWCQLDSDVHEGIRDASYYIVCSLYGLHNSTIACFGLSMCITCSGSYGRRIAGVMSINFDELT
jgi:hypothetical protein